MSQKLVSSLLDDIVIRVTSVCVNDDLFSDNITDSPVNPSGSSVEDLDLDYFHVVLINCIKIHLTSYFVTTLFKFL